MQRAKCEETPKCCFSVLVLLTKIWLDPGVCFAWNFQCDVVQRNRHFVRLFICTFVVTACVYCSPSHVKALTGHVGMWWVFRVSHAFMSQHALRLTYIPKNPLKQTKCLTWLERFYSNPVSGQHTLYTQCLPVCVFVLCVCVCVCVWCVCVCVLVTTLLSLTY